MIIEIDEVDFGFITNILCRAAFTFEQLGSSPDVCAVNRDRYRENAKMANQARLMMYDAKKKSKTATAQPSLHGLTVMQEPVSGNSAGK